MKFKSELLLLLALVSMVSFTSACCGWGWRRHCDVNVNVH